MAVTASAIGFALIGYGLAAGGTYAAGQSRDAGKTAKSTAATEEARRKGEAEEKAKLLKQAPDDSKEKARAAMERQRRIRALAGGKTLLTTETPTLQGSGGGKTLLGA